MSFMYMVGTVDRGHGRTPLKVAAQVAKWEDFGNPLVVTFIKRVEQTAMIGKRRGALPCQMYPYMCTT